MLTKTLETIFHRDLDALKQEIEAYQNEDRLWMVTKDISNSAGNLCLHIIGNLNHFIGAVLGHTGYARQRELEFTRTHVPKIEMITNIEATKAIVAKVLADLTTTDLEREYELKVFNKPMSTGYFLVHLSTHLAYHLGQINYHRRLLDS
ncbi:DinB family protein [Winogradskyella aquimaris]|uniref:DUF1572 family protein n=1 Tax=Winogradskyella aquimaris TaxID=864074 RepID=A0ABU5ENW8_9FLAO|nr:DUF1572 family protein [Winogradskyella aquimaris]MDY2587968.1 DUF1572 family protein [Winogradskyella aquimaris]